MILFFTPVSAYGWDWDAHKYITEQAVNYCNEKQLSCSWLSSHINETKEASIIPDSQYKDFINHYCYTNSCPALNKAKDHYKQAYYSITNDKSASAKELGIAGHYFADSFTPVHQIKGEDYDNCHAPFEKKVGDKIISNETNWTVSMDCILADSKVSFNFSQSEIQIISEKLANFWDTGNLPDSSLVQNHNILYTYTGIPFHSNITKPDILSNLKDFYPKGIFDKLKSTILTLLEKIFHFSK